MVYKIEPGNQLSQGSVYKPGPMITGTSGNDIKNHSEDQKLKAGNAVGR